MSNNLWTDIEPNSGKTYEQLLCEGWQAGVDMVKSLGGREVSGYYFPKDLSRKAGVYWNGYVEGVLFAQSETKKQNQ